MSLRKKFAKAKWWAGRAHDSAVNISEKYNALKTAGTLVKNAIFDDASRVLDAADESIKARKAKRRENKPA